MKKLLLLALLLNLSFVSFVSFVSLAVADEAIDPKDNYIDPATQMDYTKQYEVLNENQQEILVERCMMFTIQKEMGQSGEDSMSPTEIESYENLVESKCKCVQDGFAWKKESTTKGSCDEEAKGEKDLLVHTMDMCVDRMALSDASCKATMTPSCTNDFRYQCYQYMTQPLEFVQTSNPVLNKCQFSDQTKVIKMECRSYCYHRNTCTVTNEDFKNRKIGNMYLMQKKSRSSCIKGSTFGVDSDNSIWVTNSCHGDFALQYKDPKCGFRPTCSPKPHVIDNIQESGTQKLEMVCNGEVNESGGKSFCKVVVFKKDKKGKNTAQPDYSKEITYVKDVKLIKKIGSAICNPGGNGSAIDYSSRNKGLAGGWGIETQNLCHARFEVSVKWSRKLCTLAGQPTDSKDTCCNGLYWDPKDKTCNVAPYDPPVLEDNAKVALTYVPGDKCNPVVSEGVQALVDKYFVELATYENFFSLIDARSDAISSIEVKEFDENGEEIQTTFKPGTKPKVSTYDAITVLHDAVVRFRTDWTIAYEMFKESESYSTKEYEAHVAYLEKVAKKEATEEDNKSVENNMFLGLDAQSAAIKKQKFGKVFQMSYIRTVSKAMDVYIDDLNKASHIGQNLAWYCAHTENCSQRNWLVRNPDKEEVVDFLHDAVYPWKLVEPRGKRLPKLAKVSKLLIDESKLKKFELGSKAKKNSGIANIEAYKKYFSYEEAKVLDMPTFDAPGSGQGTPGIDSTNKQAAEMLSLFRRYAHELPLREDSTVAKDSIMKEYFEVTKKGVLKGALPLYCEKQNDYQVRVPIGKALEPLRMLQIARVVKTYFGLYDEIFKKNKTCIDAIDARLDGNASKDYDDRLIGGINGHGTNEDGDGQGFAKFDGSLVGHISSAFGQSKTDAFLDNLASGEKNGKKLSDSDAGSSLSAIRKKERKRVANLIDKRIKFKKDKALLGYKNSLGSAFGASLKKKSRAFASSNLNTKGNGLQTPDYDNKAISATDRDEERGLRFSEGALGSRNGQRRSGLGNSYYSSGGNGGNGGSFPSGGSSSNDVATNEMLKDVDNAKFKNNEADSLFERVTKRYIRTAYPALLGKKKVNNK